MLPEHPAGLRKPQAARLYRRRGQVGLFFVGGLSVLAGMTDAIGFLASGDFVSFMSGNTTRMAVAISAGDLGLTLRLVILIATFIFGNALGIIVSRLSRRRSLPLLLCIAALLCAAAASTAQVTIPNGRLLASNCFQCHGTLGLGGFDKIRGSEASEVMEFMTKTASRDIMAAHAQGYTPEQLKKIIAYLQQ